MTVRQSGLVLLVVLGSALACSAQGGGPGEGFEWGIFQITPEAQALTAYDKNEGAERDIYGEVEAGVGIENTEARYDVGAAASYGYRAYYDDPDLNDDFYGVSAAVASRKSLLKMGLSGQQKKTVDYDVRVDDGTGGDLGAILTRSTSIRTSARFDVSYEKPVTTKGAIIPSYGAWYYRQTFETSPDAEWFEQAARLRYGYTLDSGNRLLVSGSYNVQRSDYEDGNVVSVSLGAVSRTLDKISWRAELGIAHAEYEISGSDQSLEGLLNIRWQATDKISTYVFGSSSFQPGYAGYNNSGARQVYRAGYGGAWAFLQNLRLDVQFLHDIQASLQSAPTINRYFSSAEIQYDVARRITLSLGGGYVVDNTDPNRITLSCGAFMRY